MSNEKSNLTVMVVVQNDSGLVVNMIDSVYRYSRNKPNMIICDNGGNKKFLDKYTSNTSITIVKNKPKSKDAANIHGESIDRIFKMVKTKYTIIMDSDCVVLNNKWSEFNQDNYKVVLAKKGSKGGVDKHHFCYVMFETKTLNRVSFRPVHSRQKQKLPWDTGCMMSQKIHDEKMPICELEVVSCDGGNAKVFGDGFPKSFELWKDGIPIVAHFGAGSDLARRRINKYGEGGTTQLAKWKKTITMHMKK